MKQIIIIIIGLLILSCGASKKASKSDMSMMDSTTIDASHDRMIEKLIDTSKEENGKITITEIDFFPNSAPLLKLEDKKDSTNVSSNEQQVQPQSAVDIKNVGKIRGSVKSIKQTVIESNIRETAKSEDREQENETESKAEISKLASKEEQTAVPVPDPYRWRYVFFIILIIAIGLIYLKRVPIVNWLRKILAGKFKV